MTRQGIPDKGRRARRPPAERVLQAYEMRFSAGKSRKAIAEHFGVSPALVSYWLDRAGEWHADQRNRRASGIGGAP